MHVCSGMLACTYACMQMNNFIQCPTSITVARFKWKPTWRGANEQLVLIHNIYHNIVISIIELAVTKYLNTTHYTPQIDELWTKHEQHLVELRAKEQFHLWRVNQTRIMNQRLIKQNHSPPKWRTNRLNSTMSAILMLSNKVYMYYAHTHIHTHLCTRMRLATPMYIIT